MKSFRSDLEDLINRRGIDTDMNIPDYVLSNYILNQLRDLQQVFDEIQQCKRNLGKENYPKIFKIK